MARVFGILVLAGLLAGCVSSNRRAPYVEQLAPRGATNLTAYLSSTNLEIRYPFRGHDTYAWANWPSEPIANHEYHYRYGLLAFANQTSAQRRAFLRKSQPIPVHAAAEWRSLVDGVFQGLMPKETGHGVLLLMQNQEMALYRDQTGHRRIVKEEQKPPDIVIDRALGQTDFAKAALARLETTASDIQPGETQFLFITGEDPSFVLIDLKERLIVFLSYPTFPDTDLANMPAWFTLRALNSLIIRSFVVTAVKNPFTLLSRGLWHISTSGAAALSTGAVNDSGPPPPVSAGPGMNLNEWEHALDKMISARRYQGKIDFLIDGDQFFPALIQSIENARRSIDVLVYIFGSDDYAVTIADLLKNRSESIKVRVLMDEMGTLFGGPPVPASTMPPESRHLSEIKSYLRAGSRVQVRESANPWLTTDHRKCMIFDNREAYVGGMNIGWNYRYEWHDLMARLTGPVVGRLEKDYNEAWAHAGWLGDFAYAWECFFARTHPHKNEVPDPIGIRPLRTATGQMEIYRAQLAAVRRCQSYIYIENAYFTDGALLRELIYARQRGVDVRVIFPAQNDSGVMQTTSVVMANEMVTHGIRVYAYPGMTHVKAAIYDGWACIGTANLEKMSLRVSQELDVAFSDPPTVNKLKHDLFEADFARAREINEPVPVHWLDFFIKAFADQI